MLTKKTEKNTIRPFSQMYSVSPSRPALAGGEGFWK